MVKKKGPGIVVDASVAKAAGGLTKTHPLSQQTSMFLHTMTDCSFRLVMTQEIGQEWNRHQSLFSAQWRGRMIAKKLFMPIEKEKLTSLEEHIDSCVFRSASEEQALAKDKHLIEAALASDNRIASCDDNAREPARQLAASCPPVRDILWINPANSSEAPLPWLQQGAPLEPLRLLGHIEGQ